MAWFILPDPGGKRVGLFISLGPYSLKNIIVGDKRENCLILTVVIKHLNFRSQEVFNNIVSSESCQHFLPRKYTKLKTNSKINHMKAKTLP